MIVRDTAYTTVPKRMSISAHAGGGDGADNTADTRMAACWARSAREGLDDLKHRNDWRDITLDVYGTPDACCVEVYPDGEEAIDLVDALNFKGAGENVGGMHAELWYDLLVTDRVAVMDRTLRDHSLQVDTSTLYHLGMEYLGFLRVATRRAGRHYLRVAVPLSLFDVTAFLEDGGGEDTSIAGVQVKAVQAIGKEVWGRVVGALEIDDTLQRWYDRQSLLPPIRRTGTV